MMIKVIIITLAFFRSTYGIIKQWTRWMRRLPCRRCCLLIIGSCRITITTHVWMRMMVMVIQWINITVISKATWETKGIRSCPCYVNIVFKLLIKSNQVMRLLAIQERNSDIFRLFTKWSVIRVWLTSQANTSNKRTNSIFVDNWTLLHSFIHSFTHASCH